MSIVRKEGDFFYCGDEKFKDFKENCIFSEVVEALKNGYEAFLEDWVDKGDARIVLEGDSIFFIAFMPTRKEEKSKWVPEFSQLVSSKWCIAKR